LGRPLAASDYVDALLDLKDMAIERYPESTFARTYRGVRFAEDSPEELAEKSRLSVK
jgi:hypothetical protein